MLLAAKQLNQKPHEAIEKALHCGAMRASPGHGVLVSSMSAENTGCGQAESDAFRGARGCLIEMTSEKNQWSITEEF